MLDALEVGAYVLAKIESNVLVVGSWKTSIHGVA